MADTNSTSELENLFVLATEFVRNLRDLKNDDKLKFYGLFKQAKEGPCTAKKPGMWDMKECAKWEAWKNLGCMPKERAMKHYINELTRINEDWENCFEVTQMKHKENSCENKSGISGVAVSTLYNAEYEEEQNLKDENKTVFDWCKEGNAEELIKLLQNNKIDVNTKDNEGMTLLHWACDRGYQDIVDYLIKRKSDINCQDNDGQTALHYAVICEFESIVQTLLLAGAETTLKDNEGNVPSALTSQSKIINMLSVPRLFCFLSLEMKYHLQHKHKRENKAKRFLGGLRRRK